MHHALKRSHAAAIHRIERFGDKHQRCYTRLSNIWIPTTSKQARQQNNAISPRSEAENGSKDLNHSANHESTRPHARSRETTTSLLHRAGYISQSAAGIFHFLPLGLLVQSKLEKLIDHHMSASPLSSAKLSLSSISSVDLWRQSGRIPAFDPHPSLDSSLPASPSPSSQSPLQPLPSSVNSEFFTFFDRRNTPLLLTPTHEEEITTLVRNYINSYRDLPLRLYQIGRKYRDEARPRGGLLRGREFLMKDLYTFDVDASSSKKSYGLVIDAYRSIFRDMKMEKELVIAKAGSGDMGGDESHEFHFISESGEDKVIICEDGCGAVMNEEVAIVQLKEENIGKENVVRSVSFITKDRKTLIKVHIPRNNSRNKTNEVDIYAVKASIPHLDLDTGVEDVERAWQIAGGTEQYNLYDARLSLPDHVGKCDVAKVKGQLVALTKIQPGETCHICRKGSVKIVKAIEVGHTFNLGDRYSKPLGLQVKGRDNVDVNVEMGCHGIGVSRLIAAVAEVKADEKGLVWPTVMAPFTVVVIGMKGNEEAAQRLASDIDYTSNTVQNTDSNSYRSPCNVALDDRDHSPGSKLNDADLLGYPIIIIVGRKYSTERIVEIQCRQLGIREEISEKDIPSRIKLVLDQI